MKGSSKKKPLAVLLILVSHGGKDQYNYDRSVGAFFGATLYKNEISFNKLIDKCQSV